VLGVVGDGLVWPGFGRGFRQGLQKEISVTEIRGK